MVFPPPRALLTLPEGDVFAALLADPKQPHSYASVLSAKSEEHLRLVAACPSPTSADLKGDWSYDGIVDVSLRAGREIGPARADGAGWRYHWDVLAEYYDGNSPYSQFFTERVSFLGIGIHFFL